MSIAFNNRMSLAEFLAWEDGQPLRYEFDGFRPIAMTGGSVAHAVVQSNLAISLGTRLRGSRCRFYGSDLKIEVDGRIRYPDGFVACTPLSGRDKVVREPVVIFEVLSDSTKRTDLFKKNSEYAATRSVQRYIMLSQYEMAGEMFERVGADWVGHILAPGHMIRMPEIGIELPLSELYEGVELSADDAAGSDAS